MRAKSARARDDRRKQLLQAARRVFARRGYHSATVEEITKEASLAKGTFYLYFSEKREVFLELMQTFFSLVTDIGRSVGRDVHDTEAFLVRVEQAARGLARVFRDNADLVRLAYRESMGLDHELEKRARQFYRQMAQVEAENIKRGIELGLFRTEVHLLVAAFAHIGMVERLLQQSLFDHSFPKDIDLVDQLVQLMYFGLSKRLDNTLPAGNQ